MDAIQAGLAIGGRGQLVAACGSGKSLVAVHAAVRLCPSGVVVLSCPSLALVAQSLQVWAGAGVVDHVMAVCGDETVSDSIVHAHDLPCPVTTEPADVAEWLRCQPAGRLRLILVTYRSVGVAGAGLAKANTTADLLVVDEAHRTAGHPGKTSGQVHHDDYLPAHRRLYMTATPRILAAGRKGRAADDRDAVSMDDTTVFGPVLFRYSFADAIADGWLDDYQVVAIGVTRREILDLLRDAGPNAVTAPGEAPMRTMVVQVALLRAAAQFGLRRVLVFAPRIQDSKDFTTTLRRTTQMVPADERPDATLTACHVDGYQNVGARAKAMRWLAEPPDDGWTVLSNARCLGEGIDVPAVDAVVFTRPKGSEVDVVQAVGRALRRNPDGSGMATVLVPVLLSDDPDSVDGHDEWETLWQVLRAMRAHDGRLAAMLDTRRREHVLGEEPQIPHLVRLLLPDGYTTEDVLRSITIRMIENTTTSWVVGYAALTAYRDAYGHVRVPRPYRVGGFDLNAWLRHNVTLGRAGSLPPERAEALRDLGVDLAPPPDYWERGIAAARVYYAEAGHLHPPTGTVIDGVNVYAWLKTRRSACAAGRLPADYEKILTGLDPTWQDTSHQRISWDAGIAAATKFHARHGHLRPPTGTVIDGVDVHKFLTNRRRSQQIPDEQAQALAALDPSWNRAIRISVTDGLAAAQAFHAEHGHLRVPAGTRINDIQLDRWLTGLRSRYDNNELTSDQVEAFNKLGIAWSPSSAAFERGLAAVTAFHTRNGHLNIPSKHRENGILAGRWLGYQAQKYLNGKLNAAQVAALTRLGWRAPHDSDAASPRE